MHQDLPDGSGESYNQAESVQPDNVYRSRADGDTVVRERQAGGDIPSGRDRSKRDLRNELRGTKVREAVMAGVVVAIALSVFLGGLVTGVIAVIAIAVRREDRCYSLAGDAPDRLSGSTRRLTGVGRRDLDAEFLRPAGGLVR
jgi:hypothetical protein